MEKLRDWIMLNFCSIKEIEILSIFMKYEHIYISLAVVVSVLKAKGQREMIEKILEDLLLRDFLKRDGEYYSINSHHRNHELVCKAVSKFRNRPLELQEILSGRH